MGDRALMIIRSHDRKEFSPVVYLHWDARNVKTYVDELAELMSGRRDDVSYAAARLVGIAHTHIPSALSIGLSSLPADHRDDAAWYEDFSPGDGGVFIIDASTFEIECHGGYGLRVDEPSEHGKPDDVEAEAEAEAEGEPA